MWLYSYNGKKTGPVSFEEIVKQIRAGVILPETAVCESGQKAFRAGKHPKLAGYFSVGVKTSQEPKTAEIKWVYVTNGQRMGPVSFADIINLINTGGIQPDTAVCEIGQQPCRAGQHPLLSSLFQTMNASQPSLQGQNPFGQNGPVGLNSMGLPQPTSVPVAPVAPIQQVAVPSIPVPEDMWFLSNDGANGFGPYPTSRVVAMIRNRQIRPSDLAWRDGENAVQISIIPMFTLYFDNKNATSNNTNGGGKRYRGVPLSRTTYIFLGILLWELGGHNFYVGYIASGVVKLVCTICYVVACILYWNGEIDLTPDLFFLGTFAEAIIPIWSLIEICIVTKDARGIPLR